MISCIRVHIVQLTGELRWLFWIFSLEDDENGGNHPREQHSIDEKNEQNLLTVLSLNRKLTLFPAVLVHSLLPSGSHTINPFSSPRWAV